MLAVYPFILGISKSLDYIDERRYNRYIKNGGKPKPYGFWDLVIDTAKATKQKVCPIIEWESPNENKIGGEVAQY